MRFDKFAVDVHLDICARAAFDFAPFAAIALALLATEPPYKRQCELDAARRRLRHFAPAVHIKEKHREADEERGPAEHPSFVGQQRA